MSQGADHYGLHVAPATEATASSSNIERPATVAWPGLGLRGLGFRVEGLGLRV